MKGLDASGSMQGDRIAVARFALQQFVGLLESGDEIFLQTFAERSKLVLPWTTRLGDLDLAARSEGLRVRARSVFVAGR